jgi:hypothetical protein
VKTIKHRFLARRATPTAISGLAGRRTTIGLYAVAVFLYWVSLYLYVPTLPTYVQSKSEYLAIVGIVLAQYGLWQAVIRLPLGIAADWMGWHKPLIVVGFTLSGLGALTMASPAGGRVQRPVPTPRGGAGHRDADVRRLHRARAGHGRHRLAQ